MYPSHATDVGGFRIQVFAESGELYSKALTLMIMALFSTKKILVLVVLEFPHTRRCQH